MITALKARILDVCGPGQQNHLADHCGINRGKMSEYSTGIRPIPAHHLLSLSAVLDCSPRDLVGFVEVQEPA